jgi:hypothetical protein
MIQVYVALIRAGQRTVDQVPEHLREAVMAALEAVPQEVTDAGA